MEPTKRPLDYERPQPPPAGRPLSQEQWVTLVILLLGAFIAVALVIFWAAA